jgi:hypothetical protein
MTFPMFGTYMENTKIVKMCNLAHDLLAIDEKPVQDDEGQMQDIGVDDGDADVEALEMVMVVIAMMMMMVMVQVTLMVRWTLIRYL